MENTKGKLTVAAFSLKIESGEWGMVVVGSYSLCGVRIRRGGDSLDKNPIVVILWWWN